jgi:LacI family transcriptional regulator, repressor for deo operon, udp, cdd, tsx, nupC, and nupG
MSAGIEDVAARAGVSTATVSRALRGLPNVSAPTRQRVLAAARDLDYVASANASGLASGRTSTVGVVSPYICRWFFGQVISGAETVLRDAGFDVVLYSVGGDERRARFFSELPRRRVDAVMVLTIPLNDAEVAALAGLGIPVTTVGCSAAGFPSVRIDDVAGAMTAVNHLLALGHRRIAMIAGGGIEPAHFTTPEDRRTGYVKALSQFGLDLVPAWDVDGGYTAEGGEHAMAQILAQPLLPTAVFAQSDEMAMGALRAIRKVGLRCPEDISVVGFDDHEMAAFFDLTTVAQPVAEQGALAANQLIGALRTGDPPTSEQVNTKLIVRRTTGPPKQTGSVAKRRSTSVNDRRGVPSSVRRGTAKKTKETR